MPTCNQLPYGWLSLTCLYFVVVTITTLGSKSECLDEPCNSEGLDNSIVGWVTDYFIGVCFLAFGFHLTFYGGSQRSLSAIVALVTQGITYMLGGLAHSMYPNSGFDDGYGNQAFYILWIVCFTLSTTSIAGSYLFVRDETRRFLGKVGDTAPTCTNILLPATLTLVLSVWVVVLIGYGWCVAAEEIHASGPTDEYPAFPEYEVSTDSDHDYDSPHQCINVGLYSEMAWYIAFSLFWFPAGYLLQRIFTLQPDNVSNESNNTPLVVYGLPMRHAALWLIIVPWTFGSMLIWWSAILATFLGEDPAEFYGTIHGAVIYHYGTLVSNFFFHNIALALSNIPSLAIVNSDEKEQAIMEFEEPTSECDDVESDIVIDA